MLVTFPHILLAAALIVKYDTPLRSSCEADSEAVGHAVAGSPAEIRFALSGHREPCYKVAVQSGGRTVEGYLRASDLQGTEEFLDGIRRAVVLSGRPAPFQKSAERSTLSSGAGSPLVDASTLLEQKQPKAALTMVEEAMRAHGRNYESLVLAGLAAYQADENQQALAHLRDSQSIHRDLAVQRLITKIEKETAGDQSRDKLYGSRFVLRYEGGTLDVDTARSIVELLESEYSRIAAQLGCRTDERITTVVQSWPAFRSTTGAAEWSGGQFDGKIRVPIAAGKTIDQQTKKAFAHEIVHACLAKLGEWPAWLHEGFAQRLSGEALTPSMQSQMRLFVQANKVPRLDNISQSWSRLSAQHALAAYATAFVAVDMLFEMYSNFGIANFLRNPTMLPQVTAELDKKLFGR